MRIAKAAVRRLGVRLKSARALGGYTARLIGSASRLYFRNGMRRALEGWDPGHFYSPIPALDDVRRRDTEIFAVPTDLPGIDLNEAGQLALLRDLAFFYRDHPYADGGGERQGVRYTVENPNFDMPEAILLHCMLRHTRPRRIVEVGCGFSSAVILDTIERHLDGSVECTMIEPYPELLRSVMRPQDEQRVTIIERPLQEVDTGVFSRLRSGDILFVDSTHVSKIDSDVNHVLARVLPSLAPGVFVHFHDIFYPFEYPRPWVYQGRAWNEAYALRAFLQYNSAFRIELFVSWLTQLRRSELEAAMPRVAEGHGSSLWLCRM